MPALQVKWPQPPYKTPDGATIAGSAATCVGTFNAFLTSNALPADGGDAESSAWAEEQMARFSIWAANLGVFARGHASADYRLRDSDEVCSLILQLLDALRENLLCTVTSSVIQDEEETGNSNSGSDASEGHSPALSTSSFTFSSMSSNKASVEDAIPTSVLEARTEVGDAISRLNRLSASIRKSGAQFRDAKAAAFVDEDDQGNNWTDFYAHLSILVIKQKFPDACEELQKRLADSLARRRNQLAYRRRHQRKLTWRYTDERPLLGAFHQDRSRPIEATVSLPQQEEKIPIGPDVKRHVLSNTSASLFDPKRFINRPKSTTSKAPSTAMLGTPSQVATLNFPAEPKLDRSGFFECPYCFIICPAKEARGTYWKHHVIKDLAPYVCLFDDCKNPQESFQTFSDWIAHIQNEHVPLHWDCLAPIHEPESFDDQDLYMEHMKCFHPGTFANSQLPALAQISARAESRLFTICPLCNHLPEDLAERTSGLEVQENQTALQEHIAQHLQSLGLVSLAWLDDSKSDASSKRDSHLVMEDDAESLNFDDPPDKQARPSSDLDPDWKGAVPIANDIGVDQAWESSRTSEEAALEWWFMIDPSAGLNPDRQAEETSLKAMTPVERWRKISAVIIKQNKMRKILEAARIYNNSEHADEKPNAEAKGKRKARAVNFPLDAQSHPYNSDSDLSSAPRSSPEPTLPPEILISPFHRLPIDKGHLPEDMSRLAGASQMPMQQPDPDNVLPGFPPPPPRSTPNASNTSLPNKIRKSPDETPTIPRQEPDRIVVPRNKFRTAQDDTVAHEMLSRNKYVKIESRSRLSRAFTTKAKQTKFSDREIYRVLLSVVKGGNAGPGVVEVLTDLFIEQRGDVNFEPQKSGLFKKKHQERSRLLEMCAEAGNLEFVQILALHSDKFSLNASLEVALRDRQTGACRDARRQNMMIKILISLGADGSNTIDSAVRVGDIDLLSLLLQGRSAQDKVSEALPLAANFQVPDTRRRLIRMLLQSGADINYNRGEAISHVTKLFDLESLDMFLERLPHSESLSRAFAIALNLPDSNNRFNACEKLIYAGASGSEVNKGLFIAVTSEHHNIEFLKLILLNASIDCENGQALCLAVENEHIEHLQLMLEKRPNQTTFNSAFAAAIRLPNSRDGLKYCRVLLGAGPPRDSCSKALVYVAKAQRDELCRVFLEKGASPDFDRGASITAAVSSENIRILEMLVGGEYQKPYSSSLVAAFEVAFALPSSRPKKMKLLRILLDAGLKGPSLDNALVEEARKGRDGVPLCKLFLDYGASVNEQGGEALDICARSGDLELLELLLRPSQQPRDDILSRIFQSALKLDPRSRHLAVKLIFEANMPVDDRVAAAVDMLVQDRRPDMQTIKVLLSFGASVHYQNHQPLVTTAMAFNKTLLSLLLAHSKMDSAASVVFETMMKADSFWGKRDTFAILTILLEFGAEGVSVNDALIKTVADTQPSARHFEATLLQHHVDIDYKDGEALQIATERGEPGLVRRMLEMNPSMDSVSMAFPYAFYSKLGEASTLAVIDTFVELAADQLDPDFMHEEIPEPPVFLCLSHYPANLSILESTLRGGYRADETMTCESGKYTALFFALSTQGKGVTDPVVELLIDRFADLRDHPEPLIHMAIENGRPQVLQNLINAGADVDLTDEEGVTALSTATLKNDLQSMQALLNANACPNDNSLHEAAYMVNTDAITLLLNFGHDANLPSTRFEGRPPLFELCYKAPTYLQHSQATAPQKEKRIKKAIMALIKGGALTEEQLPQAGNRSLLMHALDSANPHLITKAFLECVPHKNINKDYNLFNDGEYTYSPTMYVKKGKCHGDKTQSQSLITLLTNLGAIDRYWKNEGPQPNDMANPPTHIQIAEDERRAVAFAGGANC